MKKNVKKIARPDSITTTGPTTSSTTPPIDTINCPVRHVLDRIGDKWSTLIIILLGEKDILRFNQLSHAIGDISQKMLTVTLRSLEADGLVSRTIYPEIPPRVEYQLTPLGKSLLPLIKEMVKWADQNFETIKKNRKKNEAKPWRPAQTKPGLPPQSKTGLPPQTKPVLPAQTKPVLPAPTKPALPAQRSHQPTRTRTTA